MKTRVLWLALAVLAALTAVGSASAATAYSVVDLGPSTDVAEAINTQGDVVGIGEHGFLYSGGVLTFLPPLPFGTGSVPLGINDRGDVVGWSNVSNRPRAFLYRDGQMRDLGTLGGDSSLAYDVNNLGVVTGVSFDTAFRNRPFVYVGGKMRALGFEGVASAINDRNQVAGLFYANAPSTFPIRAFLTKGGALRDLGTLPGGTLSGAEDVNDAGQAVGWSNCSTCTEHAFLYSGGVMSDLGTLGGQTSHAYAINSVGEIVGSAQTAAGFTVAFVWSGGVMRNLNDLIPPIEGGFLWEAHGINTSGQIAAYGLIDGDFHAFLLTPTG
jgi:probable HAF family extracellular repeat protein